MGHWRLDALMAVAMLCGSRLTAQVFWASAGLPGHAANFQQVWADGDSAIYYAGAPSNDVEHNALMRYTDGQWDALYSLDGLISTVVKYRDTLFVGGSFDEGANTTTHGVEYYDGSAWQPYGEFDYDANVRRLRVAAAHVGRSACDHELAPMNAAEPWTGPDQTPTDPKRLCIVEAKHRSTGQVRFYLLHHVDSGWRFPDRSYFSNEQVVLRWAYLNL